MVCYSAIVTGTLNMIDIIITFEISVVNVVEEHFQNSLS